MASRVTEARAHVLRAIGEGLPPGSPISVKETAEALRISHTPVREALERLVGEGVLVATPDRQGFALPRLTVRDVAGLHALFGTLLHGLVPEMRGRSVADWIPDPRSPALAVQQAVGAVEVGGASAIIAAAVRSADLRLASLRRVEPWVVRDWSQNLIGLRAGLSDGGGGARRAIRAFTKARVDAADAILAAVEDIRFEAVSNTFRI